MFYKNQASLIGNVANPDFRFTPSGVAVLKFSLATTRGVKKDNNWTDITTWHKIAVFGKQAEIYGSVLQNGMQVAIDGRIDNREYEKDGVKKYISEIIAENVFLPNIKAQKKQAEEQPAQEVKPTEEIDIEDIPF